MLSSVPAGVAVVLVDNASTDPNGLADLAAKHDADLVRNTQNRGFGNACNQGAARAETEFLLFLNPDAQLMPGALDGLLSAANTYPKASAMNPRICEADGRPNFKRRSNLMPWSEKMPRGWPETDREVSVLSGAALFVRRADFEAVGGFDPQIFLYHEDDDLSRRLRAERGPIMFIREPMVQHMGGHSTVRSPQVAALKAWHMGRSRVYATRKHGRPLPFLGSLNSALWQLFSISVLVSRRKRAKQVAFLKGVLSTLHDGGAYREQTT